MRTKWQMAIWIALFAALLAACGDGDNKNDQGGTNGNGGDTAEKLADLAISTIEVLPAQPRAGEVFALNVYVTNLGEAPSGAFELAISIRDVTRGSTYPVGTFRGESLQPGEDVPVFSSTDRRVNDPGSFQVQVELSPLGPDGNDQNDKKNRAFTAMQ
jgi:hypothetical protein